VSGQERTERRKRSRKPFIEDIVIDGCTRFCTSTEISEGGLFVSALQYFEEGNVVEVSIPLREGKITVKAQVKYFQPGIGAGLIFIDLNDEQRAKIKELVESIAKSP
jgi:hypothetical protein